VVVVFAAAVLLQAVAAQAVRQDVQLGVPLALEPERGALQVAQPVAQDAPPVPGELLAAHSAASLGDLPADSVAAR
jgi:hypothetical protein